MFKKLALTLAAAAALPASALTTGDVAFTSKGTIGRIARVGPYVHPFVYSPQVCYWRTLDSSRLAPAVLYCWMSTDDFRRQVDVVADQTD